MKKNHVVIFLSLIIFFLSNSFQESQAAGTLYTIDEVTDEFTIGNFTVSGSSGPYNAIFRLDLAFNFMGIIPNPPTNDFLITSTLLNADGGFEEYALLSNTNYTLLKFKPSGTLTQATVFDGSPFDDSPNGDVFIDDLQTHFANNSQNGPINSLFFGLKLDQDSEYVDVQALAIKIFDGDLNTTYSLHKDFVRVYQRLGTPPPGGNVVPEPSSILLFGLGTLGTVLFRKSRDKK